MYEAIVVVHILSGFAWVGGGFTVILTARNIKANEGQATAEHMMELFERATRVVNVAPLLVLATGIAQVMMNDAWAFSQLWIILAITLFVVALVMGGGFGERWLKQIKEAREEGRSLPELFDRFLRLGWIEIAVLGAIVVLMVYKPG